MIVQISDWNLEFRFYDINIEKMREMFKLPIAERPDFFHKHAEMCAIHAENQVDFWIPLHTGDSADWADTEEVWEEYDK